MHCRENKLCGFFWPCRTPELSQFLFFQCGFYLLCVVLICVLLLEAGGRSCTQEIFFFFLTIFGFHFRNKFLLSSFFLPPRPIRFINKLTAQREDFRSHRWAVHLNLLIPLLCEWPSSSSDHI